MNPVCFNSVQSDLNNFKCISENIYGYKNPKTRLSLVSWANDAFIYLHDLKVFLSSIICVLDFAHSLIFSFPLADIPPAASPVRYVLKIHFFIESGQKRIQIKIQFKTKSKIFISEWFQMFLRHLLTTIFDAGTLKPKY